MVFWENAQASMVFNKSANHRSGLPQVLNVKYLKLHACTPAVQGKADGTHLSHNHCVTSLPTWRAAVGDWEEEVMPIQLSGEL